MCTVFPVHPRRSIRLRRSMSYGCARDDVFVSYGLLLSLPAASSWIHEIFASTHAVSELQQPHAFCSASCANTSAL